MWPTTLALTFHILGAVVWVGGMFAAYVCLRPAAGSLEGPQRLQLWRGFFAKFFPWVWVSVLLLLGSGYWMMLTTFGGFKGAPLYINLMQIARPDHGRAVCLAVPRAVAEVQARGRRQGLAGGGAHLNRIRQIIMINLPLGLIVVIIGGTGRFWG